MENQVKNIVTDTADEYNIDWDHNEIFMNLSKQHVGESLISNMSSEQMEEMADFIHENHYIFTKKLKKESSEKLTEPLKQNEDYGDFLDKIRKRLKKLKKSKHGRNRQKS